jgi:dihydropyrimidinase
VTEIPVTQFDLAIRGGTIVTASDEFSADIGIQGGRIVSIADRIEGAAREIDASGLLALPGGIDSHVHISQPSGPDVVMADDFASATRAAAAGGNTMVLPFALQEKGTSLRACVENYRKLAEGECYIDTAFHLIISDPTAVVLGQELPALVKDGYTSFKVFMTYDDLLSHAEIVGVPIMIVHVSGREAMEQVRWAQQRGLPVHAETCPQYITLTADDMKGLNMDMSGAKYVCSPPPRDVESQQAIWEGITSGVFQTFSSDHCPFRYDDPKGKLTPNARTSFRWVPNGIPGVETRLPILFSEGVSKGRITLQKFVELTATNHARIYGLYPRKGSIGIGFDADIVLWDPKLTKPIRQADLHHGSDYTPWEGFDVTGWPVTTIARGRVVFERGQIVGDRGAGEVLSRGKSSLI